MIIPTPRSRTRLHAIVITSTSVSVLAFGCFALPLIAYAFHN